jgi:hypothetical protein
MSESWDRQRGKDNRLPGVNTKPRATATIGDQPSRLIGRPNQNEKDQKTHAMNYDGLLDALRGSTTERIVRNSTCSVLALPACGNDQEQPQDSVVWRPAI